MAVVVVAGEEAAEAGHVLEDHGLEDHGLEEAVGEGCAVAAQEVVAEAAEEVGMVQQA